MCVCVCACACIEGVARFFILAHSGSAVIVSVSTCIHAHIHTHHDAFIMSVYPPCQCTLPVSLSVPSLSVYPPWRDDDDHAVHCSFLETNFVYLWGGYVLHLSCQCTLASR